MVAKITANEFKAAVTALEANTASYSRILAHSRGSTFNGSRDMYNVLGYPVKPTTAMIWEVYRRQGIAFRGVNAFPDAIWSNIPSVEDDEDSETPTQFEQTFLDLAKHTRLFHYMNKFDKLVCLGHYAVLLIGVAGDTELKEPIGAGKKVEDIVYLQPLGEASAIIKSYDTVQSSPRYGLPEIYTVLVGGFEGAGATKMVNKRIPVHWSRLIHCSQGSLENDLFGIPMLEPVYNRLIDLEKVIGGSAEIFWGNGRGGLHIDSAADGEIDDVDKITEDIKNFMDRMTRVLKTQGMNVNTLDMKVASPEKHVNAIIQYIAGTWGIPSRILTGSEMGELASSQDQNNWLARVMERSENFCESMMLRPFIDKMMEIGVLPTVPDYKVIWSELVTQSASDKADVALKVARACDAFGKGAANTILTAEQFATEFVGTDFRKDDIAKNKKENEAELEVPEPEPVVGNKKRSWFK